jgi:hypothetical protein
MEEMFEELRRLEITEQYLLTALMNANILELSEGDRRYREQAVLETQASKRRRQSQLTAPVDYSHCSRKRAVA